MSCCRSTAFQQSGWSPEYTLTEDYALGMELTKRKWYCRYVEEYLAIGEAPEQVRNCFQQRSRWCKVSGLLTRSLILLKLFHAEAMLVLLTPFKF